MTSFLGSRVRRVGACSVLLVACGGGDSDSTGVKVNGGSGSAGGSAAGRGGAGSSGVAGSIATGGAGATSVGGAGSGGTAGAAGSAAGGTGATSGSGGSAAGGGGSAALAKLCTDTKGKVFTKTCCASTSDFADTCHTTGKCDCAPGDSHEVLACDCSAVNDLNCFNLLLMLGCIPVD